jgi:hypothetical protein
MHDFRKTATELKMSVLNFTMSSAEIFFLKKMREIWLKVYIDLNI